MTTVRHKDYQGSVEYEDGHLVIQILHIADTITATIDSASQAQSAFEELVDDYVETCKELGKEPCKPFSGTFNVRLKPELHRQVVMSATELGETLNAWICVAAEARIERLRNRKAFIDGDFVIRSLRARSTSVAYERIESIQSSSWPGRHERHHLPRALTRQLAS
jgi:predicted HicB family RNase H-like nuclease